MGKVLNMIRAEHKLEKNKTRSSPCRRPTLVLHYFYIYLPSCNFTITPHLSLFTTYSLLNPAGGRRRMSCKNSVKCPGSPRVLIAQWIERTPGVRKVMGSNPIGTQIFSRSHARVTLFSQPWVLYNALS